MDLDGKDTGRLLAGEKCQQTNLEECLLLSRVRFDKDFFLLSWRVQPNLFLLCVMVLKSKENRGLSESDVSWIQTFWFWSEFTSLFTIMERVRVRVLTIVHCVD